MIRYKGIINVRGDTPDLDEVAFTSKQLEEGEYAFYICDKKPAPMMPMIKYINGVLINQIYLKLRKQGYKVSRGGLYRYFEKKYSPKISEQVMDDTIEYYNMKKLKTDELKKIAAKIEKFGNSIGVTFPSRKELKDPANEEEYISGFNQMWENYKRDYKL